MIVARVEHETGMGPYVSYAADAWHSARFRHPEPEEECLDPHRYGPATRFGFRDRKQLRIWFWWDEVEKLIQYGCVLSWYEVPDTHVQVSRRQLLFDITQARLVHRESLAPLQKGS